MKLWRDTTRGSRRTWTWLGIGMFILALLWAGLAIEQSSAGLAWFHGGLAVAWLLCGVACLVRARDAGVRR
jgi:hypothetical protein